METSHEQETLKDFLLHRERITEKRIHTLRIMIHSVSIFLTVVSRIVMGPQLDLMFFGNMLTLPLLIVLDIAVFRANAGEVYRRWVKYLVSFADIVFLTLMTVLIRLMIPRENYPMTYNVPAFMAFFILIFLSGFRFDRKLTIINGVSCFMVAVGFMIWDIATTANYGFLWHFGYLTVFSSLGGAVLITSFLSGYAKNIIEENYKRLEEKRYVTGIFGRYVSADVAKKALTGELELGGKEQVISVLFCDIRNFTSLSENLSPSEVVSLLNRFFSLMSPAVFEQEGIVDKMIGDCLMALFGAPITREDHRVKAVRAAMKIRERLIQLNGEFAAEGKPEIHVGIGIATGPAVVGNIGCNERMEYTAIGDTVNTASRIEGLCKHFGRVLLVDERTREGLNGSFEMDKMELVEVKGKKDKIQVYAVEAKAQE